MSTSSFISDASLCSLADMLIDEQESLRGFVYGIAAPKLPRITVLFVKSHFIREAFADSKHPNRRIDPYAYNSFISRKAPILIFVETYR